MLDEKRSPRMTYALLSLDTTATRVTQPEAAIATIAAMRKRDAFIALLQGNTLIHDRFNGRERAARRGSVRELCSMARERLHAIIGAEAAA
jgi:hypothetical protein